MWTERSGMDCEGCPSVWSGEGYYEKRPCLLRPILVTFFINELPNDPLQVTAANRERVVETMKIDLI